MPAPIVHSLRLVTDTDSHMLWLSDVVDHGDFPFRFALKLEYLEEYGSDVVRDLGKYCVSVVAVSPAACGPDKCAEALASCGMETAASDDQMCEILLDYGIFAPLWSITGNNRSAVLALARKKLVEIDFMFGFWMDRTVNAIGDTGWDWIKGDVGAASRRRNGEMEPAISSGRFDRVTKEIGENEEVQS